MDLSEKYYGITLGLEIGGIRNIKYTENYDTLNEFPQKEKHNEDNIFSNVRFTKQFNIFLHPYAGITYGLSNGEFIQYPNILAGVSLIPISDISFYIDLEIRTISLNVSKENIKFNQFGDSKTNPSKENLTGAGISAALFYLF